MKSLLLLALALAAAQESSKGERVNYVVGPGDVLAVHVFYEPQLSGNFRVENDGQFGYPFLGRVNAGGRTVGAIATLLKERLAEGYLRNPQVTVDVEQFRSQSVFVMGEVRTPGKYILSGSITLLDALAQSGSPTPAAGERGADSASEDACGLTADLAQPAGRGGHTREPA